MDTVVLNRTTVQFQVCETDGSDGRQLKEGRLQPGGILNIKSDTNGTWKVYSFRGGPPIRAISVLHITGVDCQDWESIELVQRGDEPRSISLQWEGLVLRRSSEFWTAWKNASRRVEAVARFSEELEKDLKRVVIYRAQCAHLVQFCSESVQKIREIFSLVSDLQMSRMYKSRKLPQLANSLDILLCALLSAQKLLKGCDQKEWRRAALVLSLPPPDPQNLEKYSGSKFFLVIRELGWSFDLVQSALVKDGTTDLIFNWDDGRGRYVLQRNQPEDGVASDAMELLRGDGDREIRDHKELISDLEKGPLLKGNFFNPLAGWFWNSFFISLAGWFWDNFVISLAGCSWYIFYISLAGWLWYTVPLGDSAAAIQNWCLAGWPWYNSLHKKFAETIQNRCRKSDFDIDHLDLRKKKRIGKGSFKEIHRGKWLGLEVAVATFELLDCTSSEREDAECEGILKELRKEVEFMVTLHHPNVVDFFGCATQKDHQTMFLVMELMEEDLGHLIKRTMKLQQARQSDFGGVFSLSVTVDILMQIVEAMIHSHKHQVMHRDLKPGNCLVSKKAQHDPICMNTT